MVSITQALQQIKDDLLTCLSRSSIQDVCGQLGYRWRAGKLDPVATVYAFIVQILFGNTACSELPHLLGATFSASAYCQARKRLPLALLQRLLLDLCAQVRTKTSGRGQWRGHRTFLVDGSSCSMSDTPTLQRRFGQPSVQKAGCGFPTSHMLMLFDITTGMLVSLIPSKCQTHDLSNVAQMHPHLRRGDLLVGDRAFGAYVHLAMLVSAGIEGLFRLNQRVITDFQPGRPHNQRSQANRVKGRPASRWIKQLGDDDQLVEYHRPRQRSAFLDDTAFDALPDTLVVRELRYHVKRKGFRVRQIVLVTTLLDPERYPKQELMELYHRRWQVETWIDYLKTTLGMNIVKCKTPDGVIKELTMFALVYNLVRVAMFNSATAQQVTAHRISFKDALRWLRSNAPPNRLSHLQVNPQRSNRVELRVVKRRPKPYPLMTKPRQQLRQQLLQQGDAA